MIIFGELSLFSEILFYNLHIHLFLCHTILGYESNLMTYANIRNKENLGNFRFHIICTRPKWNKIV